MGKDHLEDLKLDKVKFNDKNFEPIPLYPNINALAEFATAGTETSLSGCDEKLLSLTNLKTFN